MELQLCGYIPKLWSITVHTIGIMHSYVTELYRALIFDTFHFYGSEVPIRVGEGYFLINGKLTHSILIYGVEIQE